MAEATATVEAVEEKTEEAALPVLDLPVPTKKEELYRNIASVLNAVVEKKRGKGRQVFGDAHGREVLVAVFDGLMDILLQSDKEGKPQEGSLGIPAGYGSIQLGTAAATKKTTPQGKEIDVPCRWRVVWRPGKAVDDRLHALPPPPQPVPGATPEAAATT